MKTFMIKIALLTLAQSIYAMDEIEFKFQLPKDGFKQFYLWALSNNKTSLKGIFEHTEAYFTNNDFSGNTFRIRKAQQLLSENTPPKQTITYKKRDNSSSLRIEHETRIECDFDALKTVLALTHTHLKEVSKKRTTFIHNNELEIAFDEVDNLGKFIEIEVKKKVESKEDGEQLIKNLLKKAGITKIMLYSNSYIYMLTNEDARKTYSELEIE